ncbi:hypothetical protein [Nitrosomonas sp.]|uniref:hypothetical protein n=1 Tax=Nitrosomonas sp. TaxID=42353 RepID=UPI001D1C4D64|nr:hypothetical protein [Nitrosomonas sp.]MBX3618254.1 hypothetical protein [Nitrosomonas sp.]
MGFEILDFLKTLDFNKALDFSKISIGEVTIGLLASTIGVLGSLKTSEFYIESSYRILFFILGILFSFFLIVIQEYVDGNAAVVFPILLALLCCCITGFFLAFKKTTESLIEEYRNNHCGVGGPFFDDIKQVEGLIKNAKDIGDKGIVKEIEKCLYLSNVNFVSAAGYTRVNSIKSVNVMPLTFLTYIYYGNSGWFEFEKTRPKDFLRVVIIDDEINHLIEHIKQNTEEYRNHLSHIKKGDNSDGYKNPRLMETIGKAREYNNTVHIIKFLCDMKDLPWRIATKSQLRNDNKLRYFRNYSVFTPNPQYETKEVAYFTYLNRNHENLFTKSPWDQYCTYDEIYIAYLKKDFDDLWKPAMSKSIKEWIGSNEDYNSNLSLSIKLDSIREEWERESSSQQPQERSK